MPWKAIFGFARRWRGAALLAVGLGVAGCDYVNLGALVDAPAPAASAGDDGQTDRTVALAPEVVATGRTADRIRIATFNIQVLGPSKIAKPEVVQVLADVIRRFDVVAIQELRTTDTTVLAKLAAAVNAGGARYRYLAGPRLGRTSSKEQYVYFYDSRRIALDPSSVHTAADVNDHMHREPLLARFYTLFVPRDRAFTFLLANIHTDPDEVKTEVEALDDVYLSALDDASYEDDVLILGDFNAGYERLGSLMQVSGMQAVVNGESTNTLGTKSYDNIVMHGERTSEYLGVFGVLDLREEHGLTQDQALDVSDHRPVWAEFSATEDQAARRLSAVPSRPRR